MLLLTGDKVLPKCASVLRAAQIKGAMAVGAVGLPGGNIDVFLAIWTADTCALEVGDIAVGA